MKGYRHIRRCDTKEINKISKYRERLWAGGVRDDAKLTKAQILKFPDQTKREQEGARDFVIYGGKAPDRAGMDSLNKLLQRLNKLAILRDINEHFVSIPQKIQDVHGNIRIVDLLRIVSGKEATEAGERFEKTYRPKIKHLNKIGRDPKAKADHKKKLKEIEQEAGIR